MIENIIYTMEDVHRVIAREFNSLKEDIKMYPWIRTRVSRGELGGLVTPLRKLLCFDAPPTVEEAAKAAYDLGISEAIGMAKC